MFQSQSDELLALVVALENDSSWRRQQIGSETMYIIMISHLIIQSSKHALDLGAVFLHLIPLSEQPSPREELPPST
jgi:hypothetical protein